MSNLRIAYSPTSCIKDSKSFGFMANPFYTWMNSKSSATVAVSGAVPCFPMAILFDLTQLIPN